MLNQNICGLLNRKDVLILDAETTGVSQKAELLELAVIDTTGALRFQVLIMPHGRISRRASNVNGLTRDVLKKENAQPWPHYHAAAHALLNDKIILGWKVDFDARMIRQTCNRYDLVSPVMDTIDILEHYRDHGPPRQSYKLEAVMQAEGLAYEGTAHRAEADARAVLAVMRTLI